MTKAIVGPPALSRASQRGLSDRLSPATPCAPHHARTATAAVTAVWRHLHPEVLRCEVHAQAFAAAAFNSYNGSYRSERHSVDTSAISTLSANEPTLNCWLDTSAGAPLS
jgi:hypothetical protein